MHRPICLNNISLPFANKRCFEDFSAHIYPGNRIAIIGRNGSGKSSLLNLLRQQLVPSTGEVMIPDGICLGYVEQTIEDFQHLSGGERFNKLLSEVLAEDPDVLLLDEPTNHLDSDNRKHLIQMLKRYQGTLIIVTHDTELLRSCVDTLWHIHEHAIHVVKGSYEDYMRAMLQQRAAIEKELVSLRRDKKDAHEALMQEQERAAKSKAKGHKSVEQQKWSRSVGHSQARRAESTAGKKKSAIDTKKQQLIDQLSDLSLPEIIVPKFSLTSEITSSGSLLSISGAAVGYRADKLIVENIHLTLGGKERIAIAGKNGSGKSTLLKAIVGQSSLFKTGNWQLPRLAHISYLDQHYATLEPALSVMAHVQAASPDWKEAEARRHLSDFLFRRNEEVNQLAASLSGGEKVRLALSILAANTPRLLIVDEITNNLDLETKQHVVDVLKHYPGAMIVVSHEADFLTQIGIETIYTVVDGTLSVK